MKKNRRSKISKPRKPLFYTADPRTSELKYLDELKKTSANSSKEQPPRKPVMIHSVVADYETTRQSSPQEKHQVSRTSAEPSIKIIEHAITTTENQKAGSTTIEKVTIGEAKLEQVESKLQASLIPIQEQPQDHGFSDAAIQSRSVANETNEEQVLSMQAQAVQAADNTASNPDVSNLQQTSGGGYCCGVTSFTLPDRVDRIHVGLVMPDSFRSMLGRSANYALTAACNQPGCQIFIASKSAAGATIAIVRNKQDGILTGELNWIAARVQ